MVIVKIESVAFFWKFMLYRKLQVESNGLEYFSKYLTHCLGTDECISYKRFQFKGLVGHFRYCSRLLPGVKINGLTQPLGLSNYYLYFLRFTPLAILFLQPYTFHILLNIPYLLKFVPAFVIFFYFTNQINSITFFI